MKLFGFRGFLFPRSVSIIRYFHLVTLFLPDNGGFSFDIASACSILIIRYLPDES